MGCQKPFQNDKDGEISFIYLLEILKEMEMNGRSRPCSQRSQ